jgi:hypothetical protein
MSDKIEISRELAERLTKDYTGQRCWDSLEPDRLLATEELRAILDKQSTCAKSQVEPSAPVVECQEPVSVLPELTDELRYIFGMMCFQCISFAQALRGMGHVIANKAEDEQAATIHWMFGHYLRDPQNWRTNAIAEIDTAKLAAEQQ